MKSKKLGLSSGIAVCVGLIVATSCLVSLGIGIGLAGRWFILPLFVVMFLICLWHCPLASFAA